MQRAGLPVADHQGRGGDFEVGTGRCGIGIVGRDATGVCRLGQESLKS